MAVSVQAQVAGVSTVECVPVDAKAGNGAFDDGWTWHGSNINSRKVPPRSIAADCRSSEMRLHPTCVGYVYSRYRHFGDDTMGESFFAVTWLADSYRSPAIDPFSARYIN